MHEDRTRAALREERRPLSLERAAVPPAGRARHVAWATVPAILLTHTLAVLPHEFGHSTVAWLVGLKAAPLDIHWGDATLLNALTLYQINEKVDYARAWAAGRGLEVALVAVTGPILVNGGLYLAARSLMARVSDRVCADRLHGALALALYWFLFMNLANVYDYVPIRTFAPRGDVANVCRSLNLSPWVVCVALGPLVGLALVDLYRTQLVRLAARLDLGPGARRLTGALTTVLMFGYFGGVGFRSGDPVSVALSGASVAVMAVVLAVSGVRRGAPPH